MAPRTATAPATAPAPISGGWSRHRLLSVLATAAVATAALAVGLGYAVYLAVGSVPAGQETGAHAVPGVNQPNGTNTSTALGRAHRDEIAAQPMLTVPEDAMQPTTPTTRLAATIAVSAPTGTGPDGVATGFPHTPAGAVGQLAALARTVLTAMSIRTARQVYDDWSLPGGVGAGSWRMTSNVAAFLGASGMGAAKTPAATVSVVPAAALVNGTDGPDWTLACALFEIDATLTSQSSIGYGYCERMQWAPQAGAPVGGRWMIAPGPPPAPAPNTWPGSALALQAGWRTWTTAPPTTPAPGRSGTPSR